MTTSTSGSASSFSDEDGHLDAGDDDVGCAVLAVNVAVVVVGSFSGVAWFLVLQPLLLLLSPTQIAVTLLLGVVEQQQRQQYLPCCYRIQLVDYRS